MPYVYYNDNLSRPSAGTPMINSGPTGIAGIERATSYEGIGGALAGGIIGYFVRDMTGAAIGAVVGYMVLSKIFPGQIMKADL